MPYSTKATQFMLARAHGWEPSNPKLRKLSPEKARELLEESGDIDTEAQRKALRRMKEK